MCIIAIKMPEARFDTEAVKRLENCIFNNDDGAGFMWADRGKVHIRKGYWLLDEMLADIRRMQLSNRLVVLHFRIATAGKVCVGNCHPFPLTENKQQLTAVKTKTQVGIVHNGILDVPTPANSTYSDTQLFVRNYLAPLGVEQLRDPKVLGLLDMSGSKFAVLHGDGQLLTVGDFYTEGEWFYSNTTYRMMLPVTTTAFRPLSSVVDDDGLWEACVICHDRQAVSYNDTGDELYQLCVDCYLDQYEFEDRGGKTVKVI